MRRAVTDVAIWLRWLSVACLLAGSLSSVFAAKTYTDNGDGTVTDPTTGLQWMRCSMGQTWDGTTCLGTTIGYTSDQSIALTGTITFAGRSDWRLPNIRELQTIVDRTAVNPAIDLSEFPNTPASNFRQSTPVTGITVNIWTVDFRDGGVGYGPNEYLFSVRLVRSDGDNGIWTVNRPSSDYVNNGDGTVTHTPTGLMWQRCAVGQVMTNSVCSGTANLYDWDVASMLTSNFAEEVDWRIPTPDELNSLVDYSRSGPAINTSLFPNTPWSSFWSNLADIQNSSFAWSVGFTMGGISKYGYGKSNVRFVRAGRSFGSLDLVVTKIGAGKITSSVMPGIECGTLCSGGFELGSVINLNAIPIASFNSWGGACTSAGTAPTCTVTMDSAKTVSASFKDTPLVATHPSALTYALQNVGSTSAAQTFTLSNTSDATQPLTISAINVSGDFAFTHDCPGILPIGSTCTLSVRFTPITKGLRSGGISITSNAPGSPQQVVALSGTGQGGVMSVGSTALEFGTYSTTTSSPAQTLTLSNSGGSEIQISNIATTGDFSHTTTCTGILARGASCTIRVTFTPATVGNLTGRLIISHDADNGPSHTVNLTGTGLATAIVALNPNTLSFVGQLVNTPSSTKSVTLTNTGTGNLGFSSISASGDFALTHNCGIGLAVGVSCKLDVVFTPTSEGPHSGLITVVSNALGSPHSVTLSGNGELIQQTIGPISLQPATLTAVGSSTLSATASSALPVSFASTTTSICTVSGTILTGVNVGICAITASQLGNALYAPATPVTKNISVTFASQAIGAISFDPTILNVGATTLASASATSGLVVFFSSSATPTVCSVTGNTVTGLLAGTCTITASQTGNANYAAATPVTQNIVVGKANQTIGAISFNPATLGVGGTTAASATATSGLAVNFTSTTPIICSVSGNTVAGLLTGTCIVAANQPGNANFTAAPQVTQNITVTQGTQTIGAISFTPTTLAVGGTTTASATATSGLAVTFNSSTTPTICSVSGNTVTGLLAGTCTITASQAGNANYSAATPVTKNITVGVALAPAVTFNPTSLTFADQIMGTTSAAKNSTLTNTGNAPLLISLIDTTGDFAVASNNCGVSLAASASCNLGITFTPTATAGRIGVARVTSNAPGSPHSAILSGTGVPSNAPICQLTAAPSKVRKNGTSVLTATCTPAATSYSWTGGTCAGTTASTCTVTPAATTTYTVTGTNNFGNSTASADVTVYVDLTPILMLLLD